MTLSEAAEAVDGTLMGDDVLFTAVATDTRKLRGGELFVALGGERFDGHDFLSQAREKGAAAALVCRSTSVNIPYIQAQDTRLALGRLAAHWRARSTAPVIAVTGSNGKTTVKEMIGAILSQSSRGLVSEGNLNNDIGLPLSLLRLSARDRFVVVEMGMNHAGEIDYLTRLARPTIAVITNAAPAHLEGLGSVEQVAHAKAEILNGLSPNGVAVLNADDRYASFWQEMAGSHRCVTFGLFRPAQVDASYTLQDGGSRITMGTPCGTICVNLPLPGKHNVSNALAATAAALEVGADPAAVKAALEAMRAVGGRLQEKCGAEGALVLDDSYNANLGSLDAALEVLATYSGERVLVLGDMAELGDSAEQIHVQAAQAARRLGIERVLGLGELTRLTVQEFGPGGQCFSTQEDLVRTLIDLMHSNMTVLIKGSRCMGMERIVDAICGGDDGGAHI